MRLAYHHSGIIATFCMMDLFEYRRRRVLKRTGWLAFFLDMTIFVFRPFSTHESVSRFDCIFTEL